MRADFLYTCLPMTEHDIAIHETRLKFLAENLQGGTMIKAGKMINGMRPAEIAKMMEALPPKHREIAWKLVEPEYEGEVLTYVNDDVRATLMEHMTFDQLVAATEGLETDDLADIFYNLPAAVITQVLRSMDEQDRRRLESVLSYPEDTAGGLMNTDFITVRPDVTLDVVLRYLRFRGDIPTMTDSLIVVNRQDKYLGVLPLTELLTRESDLTVVEVIDQETRPIKAITQARDVARLFEELDLVSAAVVDENNKLLGRITIDDVVDVIRDQADLSMMRQAGLENEDMFGPVLLSVRRRTPWLFINLLTALLAAWVIAMFQGAIEKAVALAILMPVVASMGGIAGTQTLTLVIRGMALGEVSQANARWLTSKELAVGIIQGVLWAVVVALIAALWFQKMSISLLVGAAILINLLCAALAGAVIPLFLRRIGVDPALAGGVVLTTVTDVVGFFVLLGLATMVM